MGFEVVEVGAVAVELDGDVVAGAVGEEVAEAGGADDVAGGVVGLPAGDGLVGCVGGLDGGDGCVAGVADGVEDELLAVGGFAVDDGGPGDVVPDGVAAGCASLAQMSMRTKSPERMAREVSAVGS